MDAAEIHRLIVSMMGAAQRELDNVKPLLQTFMKLETYADELEQRTREMNLLNKMGDLLLSCLDPREAYEVVQQQAQEIFPAKVGALYISRLEGNTIMLKREAVWGECLLAMPEFAPESCWAWRRNRVHFVRDADKGMLCKHIHYSPPNGYLCAPLTAQGKTLGVLHLVHAESSRATDAAEQLAIIMGEHIALAVSNLVKLQKTVDDATHDYLTGLYNRRFMEGSLKREMNDASRHNHPLGVIWFDMDRFKDFNTKFNTSGGDAVLKEIGSLLMNRVRGHDIPCRLGGDEFVVIMPGANEKITGDRAQRLCGEIRRRQVYHQGQLLGQITASIGVAVFPGQRLTGNQLLTADEELLKAAEAASKESKTKGGDCVTMAPPLLENQW
jgi:diguanylate cyclase (GGDEF)-like protein